MSTTLIFIATPFIAWIVGQSAKRVVQLLSRGKESTSIIMYGGMPSTHSTIVGSAAGLVGFKAGFQSPVFFLGVVLAFVVIIDALALRRHISDHAEAINELMKDRPNWKPLRERLYHTPAEVAGGVVLGLALAWGLSFLC